MQPLALIWGESLVGSGHARIQSELSRALQKKGWDVCLISSSRERTQAFDFGKAQMFWLPPLHLVHPSADPYKMSNLMTPNGLSLTEDAAYQSERSRSLLELFDRLQPQAVITEMWPFARANFDFELIPLAEKINSHFSQTTQLFSIARDIMFPPALSCPDSTEARQDRHAIADRYFKEEHILVRGDHTVIPLEHSIGMLSEYTRKRIRYVGYFGQSGSSLPSRSNRLGDVLVTSGGGVTSDSLEMFEACIRVRPRCHLADRIWRILVPNSCPKAAFTRLKRLANDAEGLVIEQNRSDFIDLMKRSPLIICHGGNTAIEALAHQVPVLVIPREYAKNNREQQIRAKALSDRGLVKTLRLSELFDASRFSALIHETCQASVGEIGMGLNGAEVAGDHITRLVLSGAPQKSSDEAPVDTLEMDLLSELALLQPG